MSSRKTLLPARVGMLLWCIAFAVARAAAAEQGAAPNAPEDRFQRSHQMDRYAELAEQGAGRGESIYFYKCFYCHNRYAKGGPALTGLFRRRQLSTGAAVNDQSVTALIKAGAAAMPGFGHGLDETDLQDLLSYLKRADCCYETDKPPLNPQYAAATRKWSVPATLLGGVHGLVRNGNQDLLEGIKVQLIAPNGVRTTVATDEAGRYEFPALQSGDYVLRVATPLTYEPYVRAGQRIEGNTPMADIVLDKVAQAGEGALPGLLPSTAQIGAQLSGAEMLWNLPGSLQEKTAFMRTCGIGCHDVKEVLRNRFDERSWQVLMEWMTSRGASSIFVVRPPPALSADAQIALKWLSRVRGPQSPPDAPYRSFPRAAQASTNVVITEYELPRKFLSIHDIAGDAKGNIWYTSHRTRYVGALDPRTGVVKEYQVPDFPGTFPGTHEVAVDRADKVWFSQNWAHRLTSLDPASGRFKSTLIDMKAPFNAGAWGNFAVAPDGFIWSEYDNNTIVKLDGDSGKILQRYPLTTNPNPSDNLTSRDGRFWAGGAPTMGQNTAMMLDIASGRMYETNSGDFASSAARGAFDPANNAWFGGHTGSLIELVNEIDQGKGIRLRAFTPPTPYFPYTQLYNAVPDKNGDVWSAWVHGRGFLRFSPASGVWRVYDNPEPSAFARSAWVDDSQPHATIWYADYQMGTLVRIQARD